jgi:hypothetical protein
MERHSPKRSNGAFRSDVCGGLSGGASAVNEAFTDRRPFLGLEAYKSLFFTSMALGRAGCHFPADNADRADANSDSIRQDDEHAIGRDGCTVFGFQDRHGGALADENGEDARMVGSKVLDEHETHAAICRHMLEECLEGFQAADSRPRAVRRTSPKYP